MGQLKSSGLVEVEVLDTSGVLRGNLILEIIGQSLDAENGLPVIYVTLLASDSDAVLRWAIPNPGTPNGIHLSNRVVSKVPAFNEDGFVLVVERWRQRDPASVTEDWAKEAEAEGGAGLGPQAAEATAERREASAAHGRRAPADDQPGAVRRAPVEPDAISYSSANFQDAEIGATKTHLRGGHARYGGQARPRRGASWRGCQAARHEGAAPCEGYEDTADHACPACCSSSHSSGAESRDASRASAESSDAEGGTP